ncbi:MAG TPA: hypothetical protein DC048_07430, partial [Planctomycetaceae bacterium]|nr:hypothetical protein [Planctomycetaceae bacterium]
LAAYRDRMVAGVAGDWPGFLARHATGTPLRFTPRPAAAAALDRLYDRHRRLVALHAPLTDTAT